MAHATGTRLLAAVFFMLTAIPPWIQGIITVPIALGLYRKAKEKEREKEALVKAAQENGVG